MPQLQHNMWVINDKAAALSIITGGGKWVEITIPADPLYQHLLLAAEKKFWRCVENGEPLAMAQSPVCVPKDPKRNFKRKSRPSAMTRAPASHPMPCPFEH
jgi:hypothetical protein